MCTLCVEKVECGCSQQDLNENGDGNSVELK